MFSIGALGAAAKQRTDNWKVIATVVLLGILGASFSTLRTLTTEATRHTEPRIPEQSLHFGSLLRRFFIGAGAALIAYLLVYKLETSDSAPLLYLAAFSAGFSDNLIEKGIGKVKDRVGGGS
jgi:hypothetical protein